MTKKIEFGELRITDLAKKYVQECLDKNWVSIGDKTRLFEEEWKNLFGYKNTVMVSSGTSADIAACLALYDMGAKPGDFIICPALSFIATANSIRAAGFTPLFVDVKKETLQLDETLLERYINSKGIAGIMVVNLMGKPCRLDTISDMARSKDLPLIVDNCEAYGSTLNDKFSLEYADFETTSHYIAHIICCGEGGTVSTNRDDLADIIRSVRSHGRQPNSLYFDHVRYGLNLKPTDLHASIGLGEISDFWKIFKRRKENLYKFREAVDGLEHIAYFVEEDENAVNAPHGFSMTLKEEYANTRNFNKLTQFLEERGIHWKKNFGSMAHHSAFKYLEYSPNTLKNAQYIGDYGLHIGCHYWLSDDDVAYIQESLREGLKLVE